MNDGTKVLLGMSAVMLVVSIYLMVRIAMRRRFKEEENDG